MHKRAEIGIFGGTGLYKFLDEVEEIVVDTPYGPPSDKICLSQVEGKRVAFLPRHGKSHTIPPHMINYRANIWAMKQLGVTQLIGPCAAGSLQPHVKPGDFVIVDQFVDRTNCRQDTFYDGPVTTHIGAADPYCPELRRVAIEAAEKLNLPLHNRGTVVVIQGPRFSTRAESRWFSGMGWEVINMTQYPEAILARELEMCYVNISLITDYDVGLEGRSDIQAVTHGEVLNVFNANLERLRELLYTIIRNTPNSPSCSCHTALQSARM